MCLGSPAMQAGQRLWYDGRHWLHYSCHTLGLCAVAFPVLHRTGMSCIQTHVQGPRHAVHSGILWCQLALFCCGQVLEVRLCQWLAAGRGVLLMGDFNISPQPVDSCKPHPIEDFQRRPDRVWLNKLLGPHGPGVADVFRMLHPARYMPRQIPVQRFKPDSIHKRHMHVCVYTCSCGC